ncbi:glycosyltransferase [Candidatus Parcubacteria bacterium]|nr:MAG: glycosyltransferase [Candidatus Parcubacteria bacterium]
MPSVCVYAICKNEEQFVDRFMDSVQQADKVFVLDTGSTDNTVQKLRDRGAIVVRKEIKPWRFDKARNLSIELAPHCDIMFCIDLDETIAEKDWKKRISDVWKYNNRARYKYVWSHREDGTNGVSFTYEKIHTKDYEWYLPVHEILRRKKGRWGEDKWVDVDITVHHYPDGNKSRGNYLNLLKLASEEEPSNDRIAHYYGRELFFHSRWQEAITQLEKHTKLPTATWADEKAASMSYIAKCYENIGNELEAERWHLRACAEGLHLREPIVDAAKFYNGKNRFPMGYALAKRAMQIPSGNSSYISNPYAQNEGPYDLTSVASYYIGLKAESLHCARKAYESAPWDGRLKENVEIVERMNFHIANEAPIPKVIKYEPWIEDPKFGLLISTYASIPYIHLALEVRKKHYPEVPCIVIDDCSEEKDKLKKIAQDYSADFYSSDSRMNHTRGDLCAIANGLRWADKNKLDVLVKMSRRFIPKTDWRPSLRDIISKTVHATYSGLPDPTWGGVRTECVGFSVPKWLSFADEIEQHAKDHGWIWVESEVQKWAVKIIPWGMAGHAGMAIWEFPSLGKWIKADSHLWHDTALPSEYASFANTYGLSYSEQEFKV